MAAESRNDSLDGQPARATRSVSIPYLRPRFDSHMGAVRPKSSRSRNGPELVVGTGLSTQYVNTSCGPSDSLFLSARNRIAGLFCFPAEEHCSDQSDQNDRENFPTLDKEPPFPRKCSQQALLTHQDYEHERGRNEYYRAQQAGDQPSRRQADPTDTSKRSGKHPPWNIHPDQSPVVNRRVTKTNVDDLFSYRLTPAERCPERIKIGPTYNGKAYAAKNDRSKSSKCEKST